MCQECGCEPMHHQHHHRRVIHLETSILARNEALARKNRQWLGERGVLAINLISSPGSGKTLLLERTLDWLKGRIGCGVIVGDVSTDRDAQRLLGRGAEVRQIETIGSCHLNAEQVGAVLPEVVTYKTKLLFIENVGNLVCPAAFELGEHFKVALLSVTEGEDKPLKYPALFAVASVCLLTKNDLMPYLAWDETLCRTNILAMRPDAKIIKLSALQGTGMEAWIHFLEDAVQNH